MATCDVNIQAKFRVKLIKNNQQIPQDNRRQSLADAEQRMWNEPLLAEAKAAI